MDRRIGIVGVLAFLWICGCGGGSAGDPAGEAQATVVGKLVARDGTTSGLDGVTVTCPESGSRDVTDSQGAFRVHVRAGEPFHLDVDDPQGPGGPVHGGPAEGHDPYRDDAEVQGDEVAFGPVDADRSCQVEIYLEDGEIVEFRVRHGPDSDAPWDGERRLDLDPACDEYDALGEVEISIDGDCLTLEVEIDGYSGVASLDVYLVGPDDAEAWLATIGIDDAGEGHGEWTWCVGDDLPLDAATPYDLAGYGVVVYDEAGDVVFRAHIPHPYADDAGHHHGSADEGGDHHQGGDPGGGPGGGPHHD